MKFLYLLVFIALASADQPSEWIRNYARIYQSCYAPCLNDSSVQQYNQKIVISSSNVQRDHKTIPQAVAEILNGLCEAVPHVKSCMNRVCSTPNTDLDRFVKSELDKQLVYADRLCDQNVRTHITCIANVWKSTFTPCLENHCQSHLNATIDAGNEISLLVFLNITGGESAIKQKSIVFVKNGCKFVNCMFNCRKSEFISQCTQQGLEAAKSVLRVAADVVNDYKGKVGDIFEATQSAFLDRSFIDHVVQNFPAECTADRLVAESN